MARRPNWNCRDLKIIVNRVGFDQLGPERAKVLNAVDTRLKLPVDQVDAVIAAGRDALRVNPTFRDFLKGLGGRARRRRAARRRPSRRRRRWRLRRPDVPASSFAAAQ